MRLLTAGPTPAHGAWQRIKRRAGVMPYTPRQRRQGRAHPAQAPDRARHRVRRNRPFRRRHGPPESWRCRCSVRQLGEDDLERFGLEVSDEPPRDWNAARPWYNQRNGTTHQIPLGITPGFAHNVGLVSPAAHAASQLAGKIKSAPAPLAALAAKPDLDGYIARGNALRKGFLQTLKARSIAPGDGRFR